MLEICQQGRTDCFANRRDRVIEGEVYTPQEKGLCIALRDTSFKCKCPFYKKGKGDINGTEKG
jgi:hypothetical protein